MFSKIILFYFFPIVFSDNSCYWNAQCPYQLYSTKTSYDTVRGDIRDYPNLQNCEAVSIWSLHRHGNRNPGDSVTEAVKEIAKLKDEIINSFEAGTSQLCSQDIEEFRKWSWNETLEISQSFLTGIGYEELFDIGKRIREKYPQLLSSGNDAFYFRSTNEQRTITSSIAFVHGLTENTNLTLSIDDVRERDDVIRVQNGVQQRLGISTQLSSDEIYALYEICRFYRTWSPKLQSPWCSVFTDHDLVVLEYRDDVRHYHRNGYGSWVNVRLGGPLLKDLYKNFEAMVQDRGRNIISYFSHDTMLDMVFCAMGVYKDDSPIRGSRRDESRLWRTSYIASFSVNIIAVLNRCQESNTQTHRVQFFINEKPTELCSLEGCTWQQFQDKFQPFINSNLDFCSFDYIVDEDQGLNVAITKSVTNAILLFCLLMVMSFASIISECSC